MRDYKANVSITRFLKLADPEYQIVAVTSRLMSLQSLLKNQDWKLIKMYWMHVQEQDQRKSQFFLSLFFQMRNYPSTPGIHLYLRMQPDKCGLTRVTTKVSCGFQGDG